LIVVAAITSLVLIIQDLVALFQGKQSVYGEILKFMKDVSPGGKDYDQFKRFVQGRGTTLPIEQPLLSTMTPEFASSGRLGGFSAAGAGRNVNINMSPIFHLTAAPGMDASEFAEEVVNKMNEEVERKLRGTSRDNETGGF